MPKTVSDKPKGDAAERSGPAGFLALTGTQLQFQHDKPFIILYGNHRLLIFGAQGALDLLSFFPKVEQFLIRQIFDLEVERRFIGGSETSGHTYSLSGPRHADGPVLTQRLCFVCVDRL